MDRSDGIIVFAVVWHLLLTGIHGWTHVTIPVELLLWQEFYAFTVLLLAPVVGLALSVTSWSRYGLLLLFFAGIGSFAFESLFHFGISNPDYVGTVESDLFASTAVLSTFGSLVLAGSVGYVLRKRQHEDGR